ncbi:MAG TPA: hypothetical protein VEW03_11880 [Longimicrobiaceae bacterium]|nr:hypothetical protein [Longimicrobiaceae bacterium]
MPEMCLPETPRPTPWYLHPYFGAALSAGGAIASSLALRHLGLQGPLRVAAALLSVPPSAFLVYTFVRWIRSLDELQRRIVSEAVAIAFVLSLLAGIALDGLQEGGYLSTAKWEEAWMVMVFLYVCAYWHTSRRYR